MREVFDFFMCSKNGCRPSSCELSSTNSLSAEPRYSKVDSFVRLLSVASQTSPIKNILPSLLSSFSVFRSSTKKLVAAAVVVAVVAAAVVAAAVVAAALVLAAVAG